MVDVLVVLKESEKWYPSRSEVTKGFLRDQGLRPLVVPSVDEALKHDPVGVSHVLYFASMVDTEGLERLQAHGFQRLYRLRDTNDLVDWWMEVYRKTRKNGREVNPPSTTK
ncbi:MAG: hypothetical protein A3J66_01555 [Candidatus Magasanikbacteria bacterium RIFCSPHIGHO2_02_FULL_47_14]|uniref:Uncharacterized protein n=1 Tax=Candidatus Magasanikbacteria bacterium RIFCSPHIGHO2_02_FULL_47_14 TaxID=1798680 RepID=A0A1F6M7V9_9BACT|nr:MAG: hypothetical protein A3J66_01555 [Candidatus Magasanikbacteria bacterium RIFCSPHIGHO2_02_FULL_47_14]